MDAGTLKIMKLILSETGKMYYYMLGNSIMLILNFLRVIIVLWVCKKSPVLKDVC